jgi:hypothetical protein
MGNSIPISDRANQKDTTAGDRMYPARWHDGGGATRSGDAPTRIDVVKMGRSAQQQRHARFGCLHGSARSGRVAGPVPALIP